MSPSGRVRWAQGTAGVGGGESSVSCRASGEEQVLERSNGTKAKIQPESEYTPVPTGTQDLLPRGGWRMTGRELSLVASGHYR